MSSSWPPPGAGSARVHDGATTRAAATGEEVPPLPSRREADRDSVGADLFKRVVWIAITAAVGYLAVNVARGGSGAPRLLALTGASLSVPALVLAWLWASYAWGRLLDVRLGGAGILAVGSIACLLLAILGQHVEPALRSYSIGLRPQDVVFTTEAMWVSDPGGGTVYIVGDKDGIKAVPVTGAFEVIADRGTVWVSGSNAVTELAPNGAVNRTVAVPGLPGDMVVADHYLWLTLPDSGQVARVDLRTSSMTVLSIGSEPASLAFAGGLVWVTDVGSDELLGLDATTGDVLQRITTGRSPFGVFSDGKKLWVANTASDSVTEIDVRDLSRRDFRVPASPTDLVAHDGTVWVLSQRDHALTAIDDATAEVTREVDLGGSPIKLEIHDSFVVIANPGLGQIQRVPLTSPPS